MEASQDIIKIDDSVFITEQSFDDIKVRSAVIIGSEKALLFDTLIFPEETKELERLYGNQELIIVYSHADWDHVWGTSMLRRTDVVAHEKCLERFRDVHDVESTLEKYRKQYPTELNNIELVLPSTTFETEMKIDLGGINIELYHIPGHTKDSIVAYVPERQLLLAGDSVETPIPILNEDHSNLVFWIKSLENILENFKITTCVPSHGEIGGIELIKYNLEYLASLTTGADFEFKYPLDEFYKSAHRQNLEKTEILRK